VPAESVPEAIALEEALVRAFNEMRDELLSTLWFVLGNRDDAQEIAQEVFLRCWRTRHTMGDVRDLRAWIFRCGLNAARDVQRSAWRRRVKPLLGEDIMQLADDGLATQAVEDAETLQKIRQGLHTLRPDEKEVFLLRQNGELTYAEIAAMRKCPVGTVKTQMRTALEKLRKYID
jgi:RNA polymerase sigma-70 factor (ECF subfamily)